MSQSQASDIATLLGSLSIFIVSLAIAWFLFKMGGVLGKIIRSED